MKDIYKQKRQAQQIFLFTLLAICFVFIVLISVTISYFSNQKSASGSIVLGELDFSVYENQVLQQNLVPAQVTNKQVTLVNSRNVAGTDYDGLCSIYVKFSVETTYGNDIMIPQFNNQSDWTVSNNLFYYNHSISPGQSINLCDSLKFSENINNQFQGTTLGITFQINAIQAENRAYVELWQDAPQAWKNIIAEQ